jgi:hypothetical protein
VTPTQCTSRRKTVSSVSNRLEAVLLLLVCVLLLLCVLGSPRGLLLLLCGMARVLGCDRVLVGTRLAARTVGIGAGLGM